MVNLRGWANSRVSWAQILLFAIFLTVWLLGPAYWTLLSGRDWILTPGGPWLFLAVNGAYWGAFWGLWILLIKVQPPRATNKPGPEPKPVAKSRHLPPLLPHLRMRGPEPPPEAKPHHLSRLMLYLRGQWKAVFVVIFSILLGSAMSLTTPWVWGILVVDGVIGKSQLFLLPLGLGLLGLQPCAVGLRLRCLLLLQRCRARCIRFLLSSFRRFPIGFRLCALLLV